MAPPGPGEGGPSGPGVLRMRVGDGRRGSGVQNAGALPCPRAFRPSGRVRSDLSSPVAASPPGSRGCVRRLGKARRPAAASAWCWICGVAPLGAFVRASSSERLVVRIGARNRGASLGAGSAGSLHSVRSGGRASRSVWLLDSVPATGRFTRRRVCGRSTRRRLCGRTSRNARCSTRVPVTGRFTRRRVCGSLHSVGSCGRTSRRARCSTRCRQRGASLDAGSAGAPLGGVHAGGLLGASRCSTRCSATGRFTRRWVCSRSARCVREGGFSVWRRHRRRARAAAARTDEGTRTSCRRRSG